MINRQQIKQDVRNFIRGRWWEAFLASFLVSIAISAVSALFVTITPALSFAVSIATMPLTVSLTGYYILYAKDRKPDIKEAFNCFGDRYIPYLSAVLWQALWTALWSMLFVIPGIIKGLAYSLTPYIIYENPNIGAQRALKLSMEITKGHKGELFVLYISFLGWVLLGAITFGIAYIYIIPYVRTTAAVYYAKLKELAIRERIIDPAEFHL